MATAVASASQMRERWRMSAEARGLVLVTAILLVFGLAVLYSASAIVAMQANLNSWFYIARQASGVLAGGHARCRNPTGYVHSRHRPDSFSLLRAVPPAR